MSAVVVQLFDPPEPVAPPLSPAALHWRLAIVAPGAPEPEGPATQLKLLQVAAVDEIEGVPGTAAFAVENEVAGAEVTRAPTMIESPTA